jgi:uncharacterized membrane protein
VTLAARVPFLTGLCYPVVVYAGLSLMRPATFAALAAVGMAVHALVAWRRRARGSWDLLLPAAMVAIVALVAGVLDEGRAFLFVPVAVNAVLLVVFGRTLRHERSMVEVLARLQGYDLAPERAPYCRAVTGVWCAFFAVNGSISLWLALYGTLAWWTFYTGFLAYVLVGVLFLGEHVWRAWRFGSESTVMDPLFRKIFPPRPARS